MSVWTIILLATACGGALLLWHTLGRTKVVSEALLREYAEMLANARRQRVRDGSGRAQEPDDVTEAHDAGAP